MKTIALSDRTSKVYATGINVLILAIVATVILLNLKVTAVIVVASVLGAISLFVAVFYLIVIFTAKVTVGDGKLTERFVNKTYTADISKATTVMTVQRTVGHTVTRVIVLLDADNNEVYTLSCFYGGIKGYRAEIPAKAIADACGLKFVPTVDPSLFDRKRKKSTVGTVPDNAVTPEEQTAEINYDDEDDDK